METTCSENLIRAAVEDKPSRGFATDEYPVFSPAAGF